MLVHCLDIEKVLVYSETDLKLDKDERQCRMMDFGTWPLPGPRAKPALFSLQRVVRDSILITHTTTEDD